MTMILRRNGYEFQTTTAGVVIARTPLETSEGLIWANEEQWNVAGYLTADNGDPKTLDTKIQALEAAFAQDGGEFEWLHSDRTPTAHSIHSSQTWGGWRVTGPIQYPERNGVEYVTIRNFTLQMTCLRPRSNTIDFGLLTQFKETIQKSGGGPLKGHIETLDSLPQAQTFRQATVYRATQSGQAIGAFARPSLPAPLWPGKLKNALTNTTESPRYVGNNAVEYPISWQYEFESSTPLV
jgi:hypothetical protein